MNVCCTHSNDDCDNVSDTSFHCSQIEFSGGRPKCDFFKHRMVAWDGADDLHAIVSSSWCAHRSYRGGAFFCECKEAHRELLIQEKIDSI